jgi:hypothetical protein
MRTCFFCFFKDIPGICYASAKGIYFSGVMRSERDADRSLHAYRVSKATHAPRPFSDPERVAVCLIPPVVPYL